MVKDVVFNRIIFNTAHWWHFYPKLCPKKWQFYPKLCPKKWQF